MNRAAPLSQQQFLHLADSICVPHPDASRIMLSVNAETSDFIRFNQARVRQATHVNQCFARLTVVDGAKRADSVVTLGTESTANVRLLQAERDALLADLAMVPDDPHLLLPDTITNTSREDSTNPPPDNAELISTATDAAHGTDMVGFYAAGPIVAGFADSRGQRNWHQVSSFHFDWSLYLDVPDATDRAVKTSYAGQRWDDGEFRQRMQLAREQLEPLSRPPKTLGPGEYRVYLTPAAMAELLGGLAWSGFSRKERDTGTSSLISLASRAQAMHADVNISEATGAGIAPAFTATGLVRPDRIALIEQGLAANALVSPRSAAEFGDTANSDASEYPQSLAMAGGTLPAQDARAALDTGIWVGNLWYLNYSDRPAARMTGMTRFATFWVENGRIVAPVNVMRFDDSLIRMFGDGLRALTTEVDFMPDNSTWGARHMSSFSAPGAIVNAMRFTL